MGVCPQREIRRIVTRTMPEIKLGFHVEKAYIDPETAEFVIEWHDPYQNMDGEARIDLGDLVNHPKTEHRRQLSMDDIDASAAKEKLADEHGVDENQILIQRIDAPCEVFYDVRKPVGRD